MLYPRKVKYRKKQRGGKTLQGKAQRGFKLAFGKYGLKAITGANLSSRQIEAARRTIRRHLKKEGKLWIRVFPDKPVTSKGVEVAMGGGKGAVDHFVAPVKPGRILFEIDGVPKELAKEAIKKAGYKLSCKTKFVSQD